MRTIPVALICLLIFCGPERAGADASEDKPLVQSIYSEELVGGDLAVSALGLDFLNCSGNFDLTGEIMDPAHTAIDAAFVVLISRTPNDNPVNLDLSLNSTSTGFQDYQFADSHTTTGYYKTHIWEDRKSVV